MGFERLAAVLQGKISNYDTDIFRPLIYFASELCGKPDGKDRATDAALRILADHSRAAAFLIGDGVIPSNDGRGYVLRKIIRRAVRHGRMLGLERPFLFELAKLVAEEMREPYPELLESISRVTGVIKHEEERFAHTIDLGLKKLEEDLVQLAKSTAGQSRPTYPGEKAFRLYDTFGLPLDFITDVLRDQGIAFDPADFDRAMAEQRERARASWKGGHKEIASPAYAKLAEKTRTEPAFYFGSSAKDCRIEAIVTQAGPVNELPAGAEGEIVLSRTPFYAESGGQVADTGTLWNNEKTLELAEVRGAYYPVSGLVAHRVSRRKLCASAIEWLARPTRPAASATSAITRPRT